MYNLKYKKAAKRLVFSIRLRATVLFFNIKSFCWGKKNFVSPEIMSEKKFIAFI
jgi:hypothetical protein